MAKVDPVKLSKTMSFLLRHRPEAGNLSLDDDGFVAVESLAVAVSQLLRVKLEKRDVELVVHESRVVRFEIVGMRIRAARKTQRSKRTPAPDILFHACTDADVRRYQADGALTSGPSRSVSLWTDESAAWRAAHRLDGKPEVLVVDTSRGRRRPRFLPRQPRTGLFVAQHIPIRDVLNLAENFDVQLSAGGLPVLRGEDGQLRLALIRVTRRSGSTWEVAKGKLEDGEPPEWAAVREVQEEMGVEVDMNVKGYVGPIRYGFLAPGGLPRLKTVHLYLLEPHGPLGTFHPSAREGIAAVKWFTPAEACKAVTHSSLVPMMRKACKLIEKRF